MRFQIYLYSYVSTLCPDCGVVGLSALGDYGTSKKDECEEGVANLIIPDSKESSEFDAEQHGV